jgi:uncharacterized protein YecT (DUF1311 family)
MLQINIATLSRSELKALLAAARARGQTALAEQIQAAIAAQAAGPAARPAPPVALVHDEPDPIVLDATLEDDPPTPPLALASPRRRRPRRWPLGLAATAAAAAVAAVLAWSSGGTFTSPRTPSAAPAARPAASAAAPATRAMAMVAQPTAAAPAVVQAAEPPAPSAPTAPPPAAPPKTVLATVQAAPAPPRRTDPCAAPPTPADGVLCRDLALNLLDRELRDAYGRAIDAGAEPRAIRESQAAWRRVRDPVSDPHALAALYERRIHELKTATETAALNAPAPTEERRE